MSSSVLLISLFCIAASNAGKLPIGPAETLSEFESKSLSEQERIHTGEPVGAQSFAGSIVVLANGWYQFPACTSSVITRDTVLTAAHCFPKEFYQSHVELYFVYGLSDVREESLLSNLRNPDVNIIKFDINKDVVWPSGYIGIENFNLEDIALIKLPRPLTAPGLNVMRLASKNYNYDPENVYDVGWGLKNCTHDSRETLRRAKAAIPTQEECFEKWSVERRGLPFPDSQICSYFIANGKLVGVSKGDSGGPLYEAGKNPVQIGVLSYGFIHQSGPPMNYVCIIPTVPQVFTRVSSYEEWIKEKAPDAKFV